MKFDGVQGAGQGNGSTQGAGSTPPKKPKVIGQVKPGESLFTVDKKDKNGHMQTQSTYFDRNGDQIITEDELYVVDQYKYTGKGWSIERYTDVDGDGYNDEREQFDYNEKNEMWHHGKQTEEDINKVKQRPHMEAEVINRQMVNHQSGIYIKGTQTPPPNNPDTGELTVTKIAVTQKYGNEFTALKDKDGNTVLRVDYGNNDPDNFFDEEEVRSPDGKLISYTTQSHSGGEKTERWFKTVYFDSEGNVSKIEEKTYVNGKLTKTENLPIENEPRLVAHVHIGITPSDGWGDPELQQLVQEHGGQIIGQE